MKRISAEEVDNEINRLTTMSAADLRMKWKEVYGRSPPKRIRETLLRRAIAYQIQVLAFGGLKPATIRKLKRLAHELRERRKAKISSDEPLSQLSNQPIRLSPGTQLVREWNGTMHVVDVTADGFVWRGRSFSNLSATATAITGTKWSGPRFFGLSNRASKTVEGLT